MPGAGLNTECWNACPAQRNRRAYYQIAPDFFRRLRQFRLERWTNAPEAVSEARDRLEPTPLVAERFAYMDAVNQFMLGRLRGNRAGWDARNVPR